MAIIFRDVDGDGAEEEVWPGVVVSFDTNNLPSAIEFTGNASTMVDVSGLADGRWTTVGGEGGRS